jgi:ABC-2 type transport system permease protein
MNLFFHELKMYWKYLLFWSIGILAMVGGGIGKFTGMYATGGQDITDLMDKLPKAFLAMFGMYNIDVASIGGFYAIIHFYLMIMGAVYAIILGAGILAKEERDKTAEFLMVKPTFRASVLGQKLLAGLVYVVAFVAVDAVISFVLVKKVAPSEDITSEITLFLISLILIMLIFYCLSFGLSGALRDNRKSSMIMLSVMGFAYLGTVVMDLLENSGWMRPFLPFKYFSSPDILDKLTLDPLYIGLSLLLILIGLGMAFIRFPRRDLHL